jgi:hypothetical protein
MTRKWPSRWHAPYDPVAVEQTIVDRGLLPARRDNPVGELGDLESDFTEKDPRKWALWRVSMVRQFQPAVLRRLTDDDLLYLAGQSVEGYIGEEAWGIQLDKNKVAQNALRAKVELETRATRRAGGRTVIVSFTSLLVGAVLTLVTTWLARSSGN